MSAPPKVAILMGSKSDLAVMAEAARELNRFEVAHEVQIVSAHRTPERTAKYVREAEDRGIRVFIVGAGMAAHLAGTVAAHTTRPVLAVPLGGGALGGLDALLATVQMPKGVPVGTLALDKPGAANAALLAVQILALEDAGLARRLAEDRAAMARKVEEDSEKAPRTLEEILRASS